MALLVNYEGSYLPPQKLWYMVDGVWKEVTNVYENAAQQELAVLDQERIKQDQVVAALATREAQLLARIDGSDPSVALEEDPAQIDLILQELDTIALQVEISKTEQVVLTKKLFEQKAQMEYLKLVSEGEQALEKIVNIVDNPVNWKVIRIAPQSTLDERLEIAVQHGLDTNDRIFNYGLVYYRLFKVDNTPYSTNDDLEYLKEQFKRRLDNAAYLLDIEPTNYILTVDDIQNVYMEVNQFVSSGAKRIEDYLFSIKDQQKYILDKIELAKESMAQLEQKVIDGTIETVGGMIITAVTKPELQVPVGKVLLEYQNVDSFDKLVSTTTLTNIANGISDVNDYPGIVKLNSDATSLNEKIAAISEIFTINSGIQDTLVTGSLVFSLNVLSAKKVTLTPSQLLFWNSPLGDSEIANNAGKLNYNQTYSSSGMYKFKENELVTLSTVSIAIISKMFNNTKVGELGITFGPSNASDVKIIQAIKANTIIVKDTDIKTIKNTTYVNVVSKVSTKTNEYNSTPTLGVYIPGRNIVNVSKVNTVTDMDGYVNCVKVNNLNQPHPGLPFVYRNNIITAELPLELSIEHPVLNSMFYANTVDFNIMDNTATRVEPYLYEYGIRQLNKNQEYIGNTLFNIATENITQRTLFISNFQECSAETVTTLQLPKMMPIANAGLSNTPVISYLSSTAETTVTLLLPKHEPTTPNMRWWIVNVKHEQLPSQLGNFCSLFNLKNVSSILNSLNGYSQKTNFVVNGTESGMTKISLGSTTDEFDEYLSFLEFLDPKVESNKNILNSNITLSRFEQNVIISQTGLKITDLDTPDIFEGTIGSGRLTSYDKLNVVTTGVPRLASNMATNIYIVDDPDLGYDFINVIKTDIPKFTTLTSYKQTIINDETYDHINLSSVGVAQVIIQETPDILEIDTEVEFMNKSAAEIVSPAIQINPGVTLS